MFDVAVAWYLFLAGVGSGSALVSFFLDSELLRLRRASRPARIAVAFGLVAGFAMVLAGAVLLLTDLGRPERSPYVFLYPQTSVMSFGAFSISSFLLFSLVQILIRIVFKPRVPAALFALTRWLSAVSALAVLAYTGFLLESWGGVAFWGSLLLPALFTVSGLSCGVSLLRLSGLTATGGKVDLSADLLRLSSRFDMVLIALEAALLAGYLFQMWYDASAAFAVSTLVGGALANVFWVGTVGSGLLVPLVLNALPIRHGAAARIAALLCVFAGSFCLRYCILFAPFV